LTAFTIRDCHRNIELYKYPSKIDDLMQTYPVNQKGGNMLSTQQKRPLLAEKNFDQLRIRQDQRREERITSHALLIFTRFSIRFHREHASMTFNHSRGGMCMEASEPCSPGSVLFIRLGNAKVDEIYHINRKYLRTTTLAEVKWCREHRDKFGTYCRIGVKYF